MHVRRFGPDRKTKIPGNHPGLYGVLIQLSRPLVAPEKLEKFALLGSDTPLLLDAPLQVEAMYFDPHASLEEHMADYPILFLAIDGRGKVRLGGPDGETHEIQAGEAVLWPPHIEHTVWTEEEMLHAIVINAFPPEVAS